MIVRSGAQDNIFAHSKPGTSVEEWHQLNAHAMSVAGLAASFAEKFNSAGWGRLLGLLHDVGKARMSFQAYLRYSNGMEDAEYDASGHSHSGVGAVWANENLRGIGRIAAYCVSGHHAGLPDWIGGVAPGGALAHRLTEEKNILEESQVAEWVAEHAEDWRRITVGPPWKFATADVSFWIRMLYSCLVDADFLDTESFMDPSSAGQRSRYPSLSELADLFFVSLDKKQLSASKTNVNGIRAEIRTACEAAGELQPGLFSLTVPTGGGKTLSSTAFAFRHALKHGMKRIIYVIPYTSIIEQTADTLRGFLGAENVVEHHSNFDPEKETQQSRLASENWDAPVIVTTSVQFFESLYACKSSRCRKLHNIAESVVILDEVQLLPPKLLLPCTEAIRQLATRYGSSIVLSTATQPALPGLDGIHEIIPQEMDLYGRLRRTQIEIPADRTVRRTWKEVAEELLAHNQVLCVVNTRKDCRDLHSEMPPGTVHLSASMCGEHRSRVIADIKAGLQAGQQIRVISTQLIEAGVDIDFPIVYRAYTGLASIAQSAGRCNREGSSEVPGRVVVFMPPKAAPLGDLRKAEDALGDLLEVGSDVESPKSFPEYFRRLYGRQNDLGLAFRGWLEINAHCCQFQFREAAEAFRMIDDQASAAVIVRYADSGGIIDGLRKVGPKRGIMRRLQRYTVNVPRRALFSMIDKGFVEEMHPGIYVQTMPSLYNDVFGLDMWRESIAPEDLNI